MNGEFMQLDAAKIHVLTNSLHYASAVYEGERAYDGKIFKLEKHTDRLFKSAATLKHKPTFSQEEFNQVTKELLKMNNLADCYVRPLIWRGSESMRLTSPMLSTNMMVACWEMGGGGEGKRVPTTMDIVVSKWTKAHPSAMPPQCKAAGSYQMGIVAQLEAIEQGFDDALMLDWRGYVGECTTSNIFFVDGDMLVTPTPDGVLHGITMQAVAAIAEGSNITCEYRRIMPDEMAKFTECFITGTAAGIKKVNSITYNGHKIEYKQSSVTDELSKKYEEVVRL